LKCAQATFWRFCRATLWKSAYDILNGYCTKLLVAAVKAKLTKTIYSKLNSPFIRNSTRAASMKQ